jgi:hypothetical protein
MKGILLRSCNDIEKLSKLKPANLQNLEDHEISQSSRTSEMQPYLRQAKITTPQIDSYFETSIAVVLEL